MFRSIFNNVLLHLIFSRCTVYTVTFSARYQRLAAQLRRIVGNGLVYIKNLKVQRYFNKVKGRGMCAIIVKLYSLFKRGVKTEWSEHINITMMILRHMNNYTKLLNKIRFFYVPLNNMLKVSMLEYNQHR